MNSQQKEELRQKLALYRRQKSSSEAALHRYEAIIEELQSQQENDVSNPTIGEEMKAMLKAYEARKVEYWRLVNLINGIEWLLEE